MKRWGTEKNAKQVVSSGTPRHFHDFLSWFRVDGQIIGDLL